jgi:xanthine dehydrogenase molybdenum-binding subunit
MNPNFLDYKMLIAKDVTNFEAVVVETNEQFGPFGAKGIGELGLVPTAPAIVKIPFMIQ